MSTAENSSTTAAAEVAKFISSSTASSSRASRTAAPAPPATAASEEFMPEDVKQFLSQLRSAVADRSVADLRRLYEEDFNRLSDKHFPNRRWPRPEAVIAAAADDDEKNPQAEKPCASAGVFEILYRELYYRHVYSHAQPYLNERIESWNNYRALFDRVSAEDEELALPLQWCASVVDEYVYQFTTWCVQRCKRLKNPEAQSGLVAQQQRMSAELEGVWSVQAVLSQLGQLVSYAAESSEEPRRGNLREVMGSFAVIGECRVQCLLGDYRAALRTLTEGKVNLQRRGVYAQVTPCYVSLYYYMGFSQMMLKRYAEATKTLGNVLVYLSRRTGSSQSVTRSNYQDAEMGKKTEQLYALLAISTSLLPQRVAEAVHSQLRDRHGDKIAKLQQGDEKMFTELFLFACPKFVLPAAPPATEADGGVSPDAAQEAVQLQLHTFLREVTQLRQISGLRSYMKLYTSTRLEKLAEFIDVKDAEIVRRRLLCYRHKSRDGDAAAASASALQAGDSSLVETHKGGDVDFYIDDDMVVLRDARPPRKYAKFFLRSITQLNALRC